jgi:short-subunit dehydrogenase
MLDKSFLNKYGPWAVVLGAAEGIGAAYSEALAKRGMNIILVDKEKESQEKLATILEAKYGIKTACLCLNLKDKDAVDRIMVEVQKQDCRLLIYNGAYSKVASFLSLSKDDLEQFIAINTRSQLLLVHAFAKHLHQKNSSGGIIMMSSLAGLIGVQLVAPYAATKAFAWNLAEALHHELKRDNIDVMSCIAGATISPTYDATDPNYGLLKPSVMKADKVADAALQKLGKTHLFIPGFSNRFNYFLLTRIFPRKWAASIANNTIYSMYSHHLD